MPSRRLCCACFAPCRAARPDALHENAINNTSYGGFVPEIGDEAEYPTFARFSDHMRSTVLAQRWNVEEKVLEVAYRSGGELLEAGSSPAYAQRDIQAVNGRPDAACESVDVDGKPAHLIDTIKGRRP